MQSSSSGVSGGSGGAGSGGPAATNSAGVNQECLEGGPLTVLDGWSRAAKADFVEMTQQDYRVELHYTVESASISILWNRHFAGRFALDASAEMKENGSGLVNVVRGYATDRATGEQVYVLLAEKPDSGKSSMILATTTTESRMNQAFRDGDALWELRYYNIFPMECEALTGSWTSSFASAAETYSATGSYTGLQVASASVDLQIRGAEYTERVRAFVDGKSYDETKTGTLSASGENLLMTGSDGAVKDYQAGLVAVKGGFAIYRIDKQFTGNRDLLFRSR